MYVYDRGCMCVIADVHVCVSCVCMCVCACAIIFCSKKDVIACKAQRHIQIRNVSPCLENIYVDEKENKYIFFIQVFSPIRKYGWSTRESTQLTNEKSLNLS